MCYGSVGGGVCGDCDGTVWWWWWWWKEAPCVVFDMCTKNASCVCWMAFVFCGFGMKDVNMVGEICAYSLGLAWKTYCELKKFESFKIIKLSLREATSLMHNSINAYVFQYMYLRLSSKTHITRTSFMDRMFALLAPHITCMQKVMRMTCMRHDMRKCANWKTCVSFRFCRAPTIVKAGPTRKPR